MTRRACLFLALAILPASIFLWQDGYFSSSDGMIHLYRLFELDRGLREGVLFPRWFPLSGYGYGLPVLNYYPPLTYYLAELFHLLGAGYIAAIKLTIATTFALAACSMFLFARDWLNDGAAFVAAIAYAYSPYLLSDAYVRGNFPEMLAMALLPLALWSVAQIRSAVSDQSSAISRQPSAVSRQPSAISHQPSAISHQPSAISHQPSAISHQPSAISHQPSAISHQKSPFSSFILHPSSFIFHLSSFIFHLSSFIFHLSSFIFSFAAIILTHHLTAMQFAALLLVYVAFLFALESHQRSAASSQPSAVSRRPSSVVCLVARVAAITIALALSAFYWVPALAELNLVYVESGSLARFLVSRLIAPADFFAPSLAYTYLPQSDALKRAFGFPQTMLALLAGGVVLLQVAGSKFKVQGFKFQVSGSRFRAIRHSPFAIRPTPHILFFWLLVVISIAMTLTLAAPLWHAIPALRFMQFPWRFQILATIGIAFLLGVWAKWIGDALPQWRWSVPPVCALALIALGVTNLPVRAFPLTDAQVDLTRADDSAYVVAQMGWGWTREFLPATVQEFESIYAPLAKSNVPPPDPARPIPSAQIQRDGLYDRALRVSTAQPFELSLKTFFFPGWQAYIDDAPARTYPRGSLGIVTVAVPPGDHAVVFRFEDTPLRLAMNVVSLVVLVGWLGSLFVTRQRAFVTLIGAIILIAALFAWRVSAPHAQTPTAIAANLDSRVQLVGYATERAGDSLFVTLYWLALNELDRDYHSYVHLLDAAGNLVAQSDGLTDQGLTPTTRWLPGEIVSERRVLAWRALAPGEYRLVAGMYSPLEDGFQNLGARVELGQVIR